MGHRTKARGVFCLRHHWCRARYWWWPVLCAVPWWLAGFAAVWFWFKYVGML